MLSKRIIEIINSTSEGDIVRQEDFFKEISNLDVKDIFDISLMMGSFASICMLEKKNSHKLSDQAKFEMFIELFTCSRTLVIERFSSCINMIFNHLNGMNDVFDEFGAASYSEFQNKVSSKNGADICTFFVILLSHLKIVDFSSDKIRKSASLDVFKNTMSELKEEAAKYDEFKMTSKIFLKEYEEFMKEIK